MKRIPFTMPWFLQALALAVVCWLVVQFPGQDETIAQAAPQAIGEAPSVSPVLPDDIPGGAPNADQTEAAIFAWKEFIALNWPAVEQTGAVGTRGKADATLKFGQKSKDHHLVWETLRTKVEIYPGAGSATVTPNGYVDDASKDYGFEAPPDYRYDPSAVGDGYTGLEPGQVPPDVGQKSVETPAFVNLDEDNEIEEDAMFAGASASSPFPGQQFLYIAKVNRAQYTLVAGNKWWYHSEFPPPGDPLSFLPTVPPQYQTTKYVQTNKRTPTPEFAKDNGLFTFNYGTVEMKSAWRRLTSDEIASGRFHTNTIRYYVAQEDGHTYAGKPGDPTKPAWREETWGMVALHINQKTPTAPYFIFATFEQADAILTEDGKAVEDEAGRVIMNQNAGPLDPVIKSTPATATTQQKLTASPPGPPWPDPGKRLYYKNLAAGVTGSPVPRGPISINRRIHTIPQAITKVNQAYQKAIRAYDKANGITGSPWRYYKLVNVQWKPLSKELSDNPGSKGNGLPGTPYVGPHPSSYYLSNIVVESDHILQVFSGKLDNPGQTNGLITDFYNDLNNNDQPSLEDTPNSNVPYDGLNYNMGGCMGCHGNIAQLGADFSFIFNGGPVASPEFKLVYQSLTP